MLGKRFLLINHVGVKTGLPRRSVVEIISRDPGGGSYVVVSAYGTKAQWYKNLLKTPNVSIQIGLSKFDMTAQFLTPAECGEAMVTYAREHPSMAPRLMRLSGYEVDGSEDGYRRVGRDHLRFIRFVPVGAAVEPAGTNSLTNPDG